MSRTYAGLTSDWVDTFLIYTRAGLVSGQIYFAKDLTFWGLSCTSTAIVTSNVYVTL